MPRFLLDTNAASEVIRHPHGPAATKLRAVGERNVCTSIIVSCELRFGALKKRSSQLMQKVDNFLNRIEVYPLDLGADRQYAALRDQLESAGTPISGNDMLIAAHALALDCVLVTANVREFRRVPNLVVENWLD